MPTNAVRCRQNFENRRVGGLQDCPHLLRRQTAASDNFVAETKEGVRIPRGLGRETPTIQTILVDLGRKYFR